MRALGPGSVSSFLKIALDVVHVLLWLLLVILVIALLGVLVALPFVGGMSIEMGDEGDPEAIRRLIRSPLIPLAMAAGTLYIGGLVFIVGRLRRVFVTLVKGDPFQPLNVHRLRLIGFTLAGMELLSYGLRGVVAYWQTVGPIDSDGSASTRLISASSLTTWFAVLVVFVLAEVFREGARLRREAELTI